MGGIPQEAQVAGRDHSGSDFVVDGWHISSDSRFPTALTRPLAAIGQVNRVREVRALTGFRRHTADAALISADLSREGRRHPDLPGDRTVRRGDLPPVRRGAHQQLGADAGGAGTRGDLDPTPARTPWAHRLDRPEPRFIALHTLSHLLIRRLAFASGYSRRPSGAHLRELGSSGQDGRAC